MRRKKVVQEANIVPVGTVRVASNRLQVDPAGRIIEDPDVLLRFTNLVAALSQLAEREFRFGEVGVMEGSYAADILAAEGLIHPWGKVVALLDHLEEVSLRLEQNEERDSPESATACGVGTAALGVLQIYSALRDTKNTVEIAARDGDSCELPAPRPLALAALPPDGEKKAKKIHGEVQGIRRGDERGSWVRIGKSEFIIAGMTLPDAWDALSQRKYVMGTARWKEDAYLIEQGEYSFGENEQIALALDENPDAAD